MSLFKGSYKLCVIAVSVFLGSSFAIAQEDEDGPQTQGDDAVYISVTFVDYKPGKRSEALEIIAEHFVPATEKAGIPGPVAIHFQTGEWDAAFHWRMEGGMADLEWFTSPDDVKWNAALAELEGGKEEAEALWARYLDLVARSSTAVGHRHVAEEEADD